MSYSVIHYYKNAQVPDADTLYVEKIDIGEDGEVLCLVYYFVPDWITDLSLVVY